MTGNLGPPSIGGTYMLFVTVSDQTTIPIGRFGEIPFEAGQYAYIGSAFGPGGLAARLRRYAAGPHRKHWHIDFLLDRAEVLGALTTTDSNRLECTWAAWWAGRSTCAVDRFGASDCRCQSHLFFDGTGERTEQMIRAAGCEFKAGYFDRKKLIGDG